MTKNKKSSEGLSIITIVGMVWIGYLLWQHANTAGWISHNVVADVAAKDWSIGEYRTCTQPNIPAMKDEPQLDCFNAGEFGEPKKFEVSFYGETYEEELGNKATISWRCKKNDGTDPSFTCDEQKTIQGEAP